MSELKVPDVDCSGMSHTGPVRADNQDAIRLPDGELPAQRGLLYGLADGMGGYAHGGLASSLALETLFEIFYREAALPVRKSLRRSVETANLSVYQAAQRMGAGRMGTTLTAAHLLGDRLHLAHVGDSRAYLIRDGRAVCLTSDHTAVGELVRMKVLSPDKVRTHAQRSILNRAIGLDLFVQPDILDVKVRAGDRLILCSDGAWSVIEDHEFAGLAAGAGDAQELSQRVVELALARETDDNASAIAILIERLTAAPAEATQGSRRWFSAWRDHFYGNIKS